VAETIEYEPFDAGAPGSGGGEVTASAGADADLRRLSDIPMELGVELGRAQTTVGETLDLRVGSLIELERDAGAPADLLVNGTPIARGEVVVIDERYGLRITEILDAQQQADAASGGAAPLAQGQAQDLSTHAEAEPGGAAPGVETP
jgi:flagellar motor switch protein FliN